MEHLLELNHIHKRFPGVYALRDVNFVLEAGSVHALLGENGAGKSTLIKVIAGVYSCEGDYLLEGQHVHFQSPAEAIAAGIGVIYQELNLCLNMTVAENIFFNRWTQGQGKLVHYRALNRRAQMLLDELGFGIRAEQTLEMLSTAQQQLVEIAKAISLNAKVVVMDEPTSALSKAEIERLYVVIAQLKKRGIGVIYVSHKLDEIFAVADHVTVLRDGCWIGSRSIADMDATGLITMMVGRAVNAEYPKTENKIGSTVLEVKNLSNVKLRDISFCVRSGEILGFSGLMGAGRTELAKAIFGFDPRSGGEVKISGKKLSAQATWQAVKMGIGYVPEDRKNEGIFNYLSVAKNITISSESELSRHHIVNEKLQKRTVRETIDALQIKTPSPEQFVEKLSGGNQQKVILGRWFIKPRIKVLIIDEPTRGIDVGAKREIYTLLNSFAQKGMAIIIMSSELPEILGMCDRICVMAAGRITAELPRAEATQEHIMALSIT